MIRSVYMALNELKAEVVIDKQLETTSKANYSKLTMELIMHTCKICIYYCF